MSRGVISRSPEGSYVPPIVDRVLDKCSIGLIINIWFSDVHTTVCTQFNLFALKAIPEGTVFGQVLEGWPDVSPRQSIYLGQSASATLGQTGFVWSLGPVT